MFLGALFSNGGEQGLLFVAACRLLIAVASLVAEHRLQGTWASEVVARVLEPGLSSCGPWALFFLGMWDLPGLGIKPVSPALPGRFFPTEPPGKSLYVLMNKENKFFKLCIS